MKTDTITTADLDRLLTSIAENTDQPHRVVLQTGSPSAGRAWRLFVSEKPLGRGGLASFPGLDNGYVGWTKREAYNTLFGLLAGLEAQPDRLVVLGPTVAEAAGNAQP